MIPPSWVRTIMTTHTVNTLSSLQNTRRPAWTTTNLRPRSSASPYVVPSITIDPSLKNQPIHS
jgi:hypothetical protein